MVTGLREPLKISGLLALDARDPDQIPGDPGTLVSADAFDGTDDPVGLQGDRRRHPPAAGAELFARHGLQGRSGDFGKLFPVMGTSALVHGSIT
jgi:hypothetical protein